MAGEGTAGHREVAVDVVGVRRGVEAGGGKEARRTRGMGLNITK